MHIRTFLLTLLMLMCWFTARSQQVLSHMDEKKFLDSMQTVISNTKSDSIKANTYFFISDYWRFKDTLQSREALEKGKQIITKDGKFDNRFRYLEGLYYFYLGQHYYNWNKPLAASAYLKSEKIIGTYSHPKANLLRAACWYNYALMVREQKGDAFVTDILLNKSIPLADKTEDYEKRAHYYAQLGAIMMYSRQFDKSAIYNKKAIELLEKKDPKSPTLLLSYLTGTENYIQLKDFSNAKKLLDKAASLLKIYPESVNASYYYYQAGSYYLYNKNFGEALQNLDKGIEITQRNNQFHLREMLNFRKYEVLVEQKKYSEAKRILTALSKPDNVILQDLSSKKEIYNQMVRINELTNNTGEAFKWLKKYNLFEDSLHNSETNIKINELETKFRTVEKEKQIGALQAAKREAELSSQNSRLTSWSLFITCLLLLVVAGISFLYYRNNKKLLIEKENNHLQQLKDIQLTEKIRYGKALMAGEEIERQRLARDLHDGLGGALVGIKMSLSGKIAESTDQDYVSDLIPVIKQLDNSVSELRHIAHNMMPANLIKFGLEVAIKDLCETIPHEQIKVSYQAYGIRKDIPEQTELYIYRIIQELLNNALKHSEATEILVQCSQEGKIFSIAVEDNGKGFETETLDKAKGMGFTNIRNRVGFLNGHIDIESSTGEGTTVNIEVYV